MVVRVCILTIVALLFARPACAFDPVTMSAAYWLTTSVGMPLAYVFGVAFAYSPPIRVFGTQQAVYGLDWGSLACHADNVYGVQLGFCGGSVEDSIYGLQLGVLASGYAQEELPFDEYHYCNLDHCRMNGLQFGLFAAKTAMANGFQVSVGYSGAKTVNGFQVGLVNATKRLRGMQIGLYNSAERGCGMQVGVVNCAESGAFECMPVLNLVF